MSISVGEEGEEKKERNGEREGIQMGETPEGNAYVDASNNAVNI